MKVFATLAVLMLVMVLPASALAGWHLIAPPCAPTHTVTLNDGSKTRFVQVRMAEGLDLGPAELAVRKELAAKAPLAYLAPLWRSLSPEARAALEAAWQLEMEGAPLRTDRKRRSQGAPPMALDEDGSQ